MVTIPLFISVVVRRDAIDRAGRTTSRAVIDARKKWHDDDDWYDDELIVFRGGMGGDEVAIMKELEQEMGITIMRVNGGKWEAVDGVVVSHLGGYAAPCPWLAEKIAGFTHQVCLKKQGFWRRVLQRCRRSDQ